MKHKDNILYCTLFGVLMVLLFMPLAQEHCRLFKFKQLKGVYVATPKPVLSFEKYTDGSWQKQVESYISENFGFREPVIRLYNQYVYDLFKKTYSHEIAIGKDGWLYQKDGINQYFGLMNSRYQRTNEEFPSALDCEIRSLLKIRQILKEYDVELMTFTLPVKSYVYPEHIRPHRFEDTLFDAGRYYDQQLASAGFPHINMTPWFKDIRDDYPFILFYQKGSHWASGAVIGTDSVFRYMETLKGERFPRIVMGEPYEVPEKEVDSMERDLSMLLNTFREPKQRYPLYEFPVSIEADSTSVRPNVLFVGSSYYWYMTSRIPFEKVFSNRDFMYYNYTYFTNEEKHFKKMEQVNMLRELLTHDYVVYFKNAPQLYSDGFQFFGKSLIALCISNERLEEKTNEIADSLMRASNDPNAQNQRGLYRYHAQFMLKNNPELFEELQGDAVPTARNPRIKYVLYERKIRNDRTWSFLLESKAKNDSVDYDKLVEKESYNLVDGYPLLKRHSFFTTYDYFEFLLEETLHNMRMTYDMPSNHFNQVQLALDSLEKRVERHEFDHDSLMMAACAMNAIVRNQESKTALASLQSKAVEKGFSIDKMLREDVIWCFNNIGDWSRFVNENTVNTAFEFYKIERKMRHDAPSMTIVNQKRHDENLPFRVAIDREVLWLYNQKK